MTWCSASPSPAAPPNCRRWSAPSACSSTPCRCAWRSRRARRSPTGCTPCRRVRPNSSNTSTARCPTCSAAASCRPAQRCSTASWRSRIIPPRWRLPPTSPAPSASPRCGRASAPTIPPPCRWRGGPPRAEMAAAADTTRTIRITEVRPVERTNYPLTLQVALGATLSLRLMYDADRFAADAIARLVGHFTRLLGGLITDPARPLFALSPLDAAEGRQLIAPPADRTAWRQDRCLHELFAAWAARTPDAVALSCADETLSYGELESRANRLAHHLRSLGVGPDVVVGLCVERSLDMVVGLLGILKAGGAYLPLDPGLPPDRLAYMLADARAPVLITQDALADLLPESEAVRIRLDADAPAIARQPATQPDSGADTPNTAYC